jgi:acylphosphatase
MAARHLVIHGRVQGVGFRASLAWEADKLGITGWVRNCRSGTVEAMIQGGDEAVALLIGWARRGPPGARVERVEVELGSGEFSDFQQLPAA